MQESNINMSNVPNLRFPEFSGEWEVKKLGDACKMQAGKFVSASEINIKPNDDLFPCYGGNGLRGYTKSFNQDGKYSLIGRQGALCGNVTLADRKFHATEHAVVVTPNTSIDTDWMFYLLTYLNLNQYATGMAQPGLSVQNLEKIEATIPKSKAEQQKIATFLSLIEERIQTQNKLIEEFKILKAALSQKIFSQQLRFKDDNGTNFSDWEVKRLNEVCKIVMGQSPNSISYNTEEIGFPLIQGNADIFNRITSPRNWTTEITKECLIGDLILTVRAPVGAVAKSVHNACIGRGVCAIRGNSGNSNEFIYQFLLDYEDKWTKLEQGSTFTAVSGNEIKKVEIFIPCLEEQTKIANFLLGIDEKMETENGVLEQYQQQKQYLLSNLFI